MDRIRNTGKKGMRKLRKKCFRSSKNNILENRITKYIIMKWYKKKKKFVIEEEQKFKLSSKNC